jgi:glycine/D-amino acid oxidase-like deaminating enzyme
VTASNLTGSPTYADLSLWHATCGDPLLPRPGLPGDIDVDVAIVGAGFTGLWTAYYLAAADPGLRIAVIERDIAGFGASGRNGGWASALFPTSRERLAGIPGSSRERANAQIAAMRTSIGEIERVLTVESLDCDFHRGGTVVFARTPVQLERARAEVDDARAWGDTEADLRLLSAAETTEMVAVSGALGATYTPHCARIHPAKLARGLAAAVERRGVALYEQTEVTAIAPQRVSTQGGSVRASYVLRATEGYTARLPGLRRSVAPVYSLVVATEPLPDDLWAHVGLTDAPTFSDERHLIIYGQRTADGRIVFGGRGAPYHFASSVAPEHDHEGRVFADLRSTLVELFPMLRDVRFSHAWGGPLGVPRDWMASVGLDRSTGLGWAGGYVGDGVTTTNLAGRTLADLVRGEESDLTRLPWVNHRSRRWEPEPLRWLGVNAGLRAMALADAEERRTGKPSRIARAMSPLLGGH